MRPVPFRSCLAAPPLTAAARRPFARLLAALALLCGGALAGLAPPVQAFSLGQATQPLSREARTDEVRGRLLVPVASVQPGQTVEFGLRQQIKAGWHTYWANPGDSGLPTTIGWTAPAGTVAGPIRWPAPERHDIGPITNYGYSGEVTLLAPLTLPRDLVPGSTLRLRADVRWLVCSDVCIPQDVAFAVDLPVSTAPSAPSADAAALESVRAALPRPLEALALWHRDADRLVLRIDAAALPPHRQASFFAGVVGEVRHAAPQKLGRSANGAWQLELSAGDTPPRTGAPAIGVLVLQAGPGTAAVKLSLNGGTPALVPAVKAPDGQATPSPLPAASPAFSGVELAIALGLALLGGLVLNLMPCVFPVLSIKALGLVRQAGDERSALRRQGLAYTAGVLACFLALAGALLALKAGGQVVGWGFQFQSPVFVLLMALLFFALGLQLSGVLAVGGSVAGVGSGLAARPGLSGSFFTGALAAVVATPCTAPFMGAAVGYALAQPAVVTLSVFAALGLGLALPYLLLCEWPALQRRLPRPGPWMDTLKQALAFPMYASAAWLAWVLAQQAGAPAVGTLMAAAVALGFAAWLWGRTGPQRLMAGPTARWGWVLGSSAVALAGASVLFASLSVRGSSLEAAEQAAADAAGSAPLTADGDGSSGDARLASGWTPFTPQRLAALRAEGRPVFVNLTAAWCITCLVNERVALDVERIDRAFVQAGITRLKGDWTRGDPRITALLAEHGRSGVPLYLMYPAGGGAAAVLPQILTPDAVEAAIRAASGDRPGQAAAAQARP